MPSDQMTSRRWTWVLVALAVVLRAAAVLVLQSHLVPHSTYEHGEIAENLLAGRGFSVRFLGAEGPTSQQAPVYPFLVAAAYAVGGVGTPRALLILELGQAVIGGLLVLGVVRLMSEIVPGRPGMAVVAGLVAAGHPTLVYSATHVQVACLAATLLTWTLVWAYRLSRSGSTRDSTGLGVVGAVLTLTDPILALVAPAALWILVRGRGGWRPSVRPAAVASLAAAAVVAPWTVRNALVHQEFVSIKSSFGYAFWQGNCRLSEGTDKVVRPSVERALDGREAGLKGLNDALWDARHKAGYLDDIALTKADYETLGKLSEPARSRLLFHRAINDLRADPWRYPQLCARRLGYFVFFDETNPKTRNLVYRAGHLGLTLLAVMGWTMMGPDLRRRFAPTALVAVLVTLFHTLTITSARFHVPIEPLMALWTAGVAVPVGAVVSRSCGEWVRSGTCKVS